MYCPAHFTSIHIQKTDKFCSDHDIYPSLSLLFKSTASSIHPRVRLLWAVLWPSSLDDRFLFLSLALILAVALLFLLPSSSRLVLVAKSLLLLISSRHLSSPIQVSSLPSNYEGSCARELEACSEFGVPLLLPTRLKRPLVFSGTD